MTWRETLRLCCPSAPFPLPIRYQIFDSVCPARARWGARVLRPFTDLAVRSLASSGLAGDYLDPGLPGLFLRVGRKSASWSVMFKVAGEGGQSATGHRLKGKAKRLHLGDFPAIGLGEARRRASSPAPNVSGDRRPGPPLPRAFDQHAQEKVLTGLASIFLRGAPTLSSSSWWRFAEWRFIRADGRRRTSALFACSAGLLYAEWSLSSPATRSCMRPPAAAPLSADSCRRYACVRPFT
jgi:hypothetical protein